MNPDKNGQPSTKSLLKTTILEHFEGVIDAKSAGQRILSGELCDILNNTTDQPPQNALVCRGKLTPGASECEDGCPFLSRKNVAAREQKVSEQEINRLLGYLKGKEASTDHVQILDVFPTKPCLSLDIANP